MGFYIPSFAETTEVAASLGQWSAAPELWDNLIAWYPLNEGAGEAPRDLSKVRNHGEFVNTPTWSTGKVGRALALNGTDAQVQASALPVYDCLPISVSAWFRTSTSASQRGIFSHYVVASNNGWMLYMESGKVAFWYYAGGSTVGITYNTLISPSTVNDNEWHHVHAVVFGAAGGELRVDGKLVDTATWSNSVVLPSSAAPIRIGSYSGLAGYYFPGQIANCAAWDAAHTPSQAARLYTDPWGIGTRRRRLWPAVVATTPQLAPDSTSHGHGAESPAIGEQYGLAAEDSLLVQSAESPTIWQTQVLAPEGTSHNHAAIAPDLTQLHRLVANACRHAQIAEAAALLYSQVSGPYRVSAGGLFRPGSLAGDVQLAGTSAGSLFIAGSCAGRVYH